MWDGVIWRGRGIRWGGKDDAGADSEWWYHSDDDINPIWGWRNPTQEGLKAVPFQSIVPPTKSFDHLDIASAS